MIVSKVIIKLLFYHLSLVLFLSFVACTNKVDMNHLNDKGFFICHTDSDCLDGWSCEEDLGFQSRICVQSRCKVWQTRCSGTCTDLKRDPANCGACGNVCPENQGCSDGKCCVPTNGGIEICDGIDNDCDGVTDEDGCNITYYCDSDSDGFYSMDPSGGCDSLSCVPQGCTQNQGDDCDDINKYINPSENETCDGLDNDCDSNIDEGGVCLQFYYCDKDND